jgi:hypothetical protein
VRVEIFIYIAYSYMHGGYVYIAVNVRYVPVPYQDFTNSVCIMSVRLWARMFRRA